MEKRLFEVIETIAKEGFLYEDVIEEAKAPRKSLQNQLVPLVLLKISQSSLLVSLEKSKTLSTIELSLSCLQTTVL